MDIQKSATPGPRKQRIVWAFNWFKCRIRISGTSPFNCPVSGIELGVAMFL